MTKLSIVMPTWNGARFLKPQLDSILAQTDGDFELIVVDDGSSDETVAIVDEYACLDRRIRRLPSEGNKGQVHRLVELIGAASGEFIAISDQDDVWHPERNARLLAAIGNRALAMGRSQLIDSEGRDLGQSLLGTFNVDASRVGPLSALFVPLVSAHAAIVRREWIDVGAFYGIMPFDQALGLEALFSTGMAYVDDAIVSHRLHGGNQLNGNALARNSGKRLLSRYRIKTSFGFLGPARLWFAQRLDQLGRSAVLDADARRDFKDLAGQCWHIWYGTGSESRVLEADFHRRLDRFAASDEDRAFFARNIRSLTRPRLSAVNLGIGFELYWHNTYSLAHANAERA